MTKTEYIKDYGYTFESNAEILWLCGYVVMDMPAWPTTMLIFKCRNID